MSAVTRARWWMPRNSGLPGGAEVAARVSVITSSMRFLRCGSCSPDATLAQPRDDFAGDDLDLIRPIAVRDENQLLHADRELRAQLRETIVDAADDRRILGRLAPGGVVPLLAEPGHHLALDRAARGA